MARPHGVRGEVRVILYNPESTLLADIDRVLIGGTAHDLLAARPVKGAFLLRLAGVNDRDQAEPLRNQAVSVAREHIPLEEGEVLLADLIGCDVVLPDGTPYGTIDGIDTGAQDRLVIRQGAIERLLPLVPEFVTDVDLDAARVVVSPPEGLPETPRKPDKPARSRRRGP